MASPYTNNPKVLFGKKGKKAKVNAHKRGFPKRKKVTKASVVANPQVGGPQDLPEYQGDLQDQQSLPNEPMPPGAVPITGAPQASVPPQLPPPAFAKRIAKGKKGK